MFHMRLKNLLDCVDTHKKERKEWTEEAAQEVCGKEWNSLRASSIKGDLRFANVNMKYYGNHVVLQESGEEAF